MMCGKAIWILGVVLVLAFGAEVGRSEIQCFQAITSLMPCQEFLMGSSSSVSVPCCEGAAALSRAVGSDRAEIKTLCYCFKQAVVAMGINPDRAKQLPQLCNVAVPVPIDPSINCDSL